MSAPLLARVPPQSLEAEQATLGAMLTDRRAIEDVLESLQSEDFYSPQHQALYRAMVTLYGENSPTDLVTLQAHLQDLGQIEATGGMPYLFTLQELSPVAAMIDHYARIVREKSMLRGLIRAAGEIRNMAQSAGDEDIDTILARCEAEVAAVSERGGMKDTLRPLREVMSNTYDSLETQQDVTHREELHTGLTRFDLLTGGLKQGGVTVVAGRPREGKTTLTVNWLSHLALREKVPVALFSLEMNAHAIGQKIIAAEGGVDAFKLRMGHLTQDDWSIITATVGKVYSAPFYVDDSRGQTVERIAAKARRAARKYGVRVIAIDHFQRLRLGARAESARLAWVECMHNLQVLAGDANLAVLLPSQIGRGIGQRVDRRPTLEDLKETGALEEDADMVVMLYHPQGGPAEGVMDLIVEKNRFGESGQTVHAYWDPRHQRFRDVADSEGASAPRGSTWWKKDGSGNGD